MRPTLLTQRLGVAWFTVALLAAFAPLLLGVWIGLGILLATLLLIDALLLVRRKPLVLERSLSDSLALGVWTEVQLTLHNATGRTAVTDVFDHAPVGFDLEGLPRRLEVPPGGFTRFAYRLRARERGTVQFGPTELLPRSPLGLWLGRDRVGEGHALKVYPNFAPVVRYSLLAIENRASQMGIRRKPRRGEGLDFHQLRDYREGDRPQQIDWKATSRRRQLISREYQEERDQNVLFLVDSGRRMRSMDGDLSHFDHCLNAILLLSYIALRQGDSVGVVGFGGSNRQVVPVKGSAGLTRILNGIFDYQPTTAPSDYALAAHRAISVQRRRALVILMTNLRGEDASELESALQTLRRRHLVIVVSLREATVDALASKEVHDLDDALGVSAAELYSDERARVIGRLRSRHVHALDVTAQELPVTLANRYLDIKRAGAL